MPGLPCVAKYSWLIAVVDVMRHDQYCQHILQAAMSKLLQDGVPHSSQANFPEEGLTSRVKVPIPQLSSALLEPPPKIGV